MISRRITATLLALLILCSSLFLLSGCSQKEEPSRTESLQNAETSESVEDTSETPVKDDNPPEDTTTTGGTRLNPAKFNETLTYNGMGEVVNSFKAELTVTEVIRGEEAWTLAKDGNSFNDEPDEGKEYILVKFRIKMLESKDDEKVSINNALFNFVSKDGVEYTDFVSISGLKPELTDMYAGGESEGYAYQMVDIGDSPLVVFLDYMNNGTWFATDSNGGTSPNAKDDNPPKTEDTNPPKTTANTSDGTRLNPAQLNETFIYDGMDEVVNSFKAELTVTEVIRGEEAWTLAKNGNRFNDEPAEGKEYILVKFKIKMLESKDDEKVSINNALFDFVSKSGVEYNDFVSISGLKPELTDMYAGGESEGYAYQMVDIGDSPLVVFLDYINNGLWFATQ